LVGERFFGDLRGDFLLLGIFLYYRKKKKKLEKKLIKIEINSNVLQNKNELLGFIAG
jgi:hypothetical protein